MEKKEPPVLEDPIMKALCRDFGPFQLKIFFLICFSKFPSGWVQLATVFLTAPTEPFCADPTGVDYCSKECKKIDYDRSVFKETIITEWDLVCGRTSLASLSQSIVMFGIMTGAIFFGIWGDKQGRKVAFCWGCVVQMISGLCVCIAPWFMLHLVFRYFVSFATGGCMVTSFILLMEVIGSGKREMASILYQIPFNLGHAFLPLSAYYLRYWRWYYFSFSIVSVGYLIFFFTIPESARWCLATGRLDRAKEILEIGAKQNKCPTDKIGSIVDDAYKQIETGARKKGNVLDLFRTPKLRKRSILMAYNWWAVCLTYFGVSQYVSKLSGDIFINVLIGAFLGVPGTIVCIPMTKYLGRRLSLLISNMLSGVCLVAIGFLSADAKHTNTLQVTLATIGLFGASVTFPNVYLYAGELFPTNLRTTGIGMCSFIGRIGSIIAPFITQLSDINLIIPPIVFGASSILAFVATLFLPETRGKPLWDTPDEIEQLEK